MTTDQISKANAELRHKSAPVRVTCVLVFDIIKA